MFMNAPFLVMHVREVVTIYYSNECLCVMHFIHYFYTLFLYSKKFIFNTPSSFRYFANQDNAVHVGR